MSQAEPHIAGEFEIEQRPEDVWRALRHGLGLLLPWMGVMWVGSVIAALNSVREGDGESSAPWVALGLTVSLGALAWSSFKTARATRRYRVSIAESYLGVVQDASEVRLMWSAVQTVKQGAGMLSLRSGHTGIVLPWYRLSEVQRQAIEERLRAHGKDASASRVWRRRGVLWFSMIVLFFTIYNIIKRP